MKLASIARNSLVLAGVFTSLLSAWGQTIQVSKENRTIAITATASAETVADRAEINVGFTLYGSDQERTYSDAAQVSNAILKALQSAGVKTDAIASMEQNLSPLEDSDKARYDKGIRFLCVQRWLVTVPAGAAAETLHAAITAGANNSGGISWTLADDRGLESEAATKALADTQQIAERMVKGLNARLGPLVYASNQEPSRPVAFAMEGNGAPLAMRGKSEGKPLAILPGKISRSATIYAVFALE
jgi:uncharacterized protein